MTADDLFLPAGYRENEQASADAAGTPFWEDDEAENDVRYQDPVYRWASRLVRERRWSTVMDIGCGDGHKLAARLGSTGAHLVGVDQASATRRGAALHPGVDFRTGDLADDHLWSALDDVHAELVLCVDVIEHVSDPRSLLAHLHHTLGTDGTLLLSTPDRSRLDGAHPLGPPRNHRHVREWTALEMAALVQAEGFTIMEQRSLLPRAYSPTFVEARRFLGRAVRKMPLPDPRSCLALLMRTT